MFLILHPEDLKSEYKGDKKKPNLEDFNITVTNGVYGVDKILIVNDIDEIDIILYRYKDQTLVLKGPAET